MTFKSFTTVDELLDLLVKRFQIQPPAELEPVELEHWRKFKQTVVQMRFVLVSCFGLHRTYSCRRVLNVIKALLSEQDTLEQDDMHILPRIESFLRSPEGSQMGATKLLLILVDRAVSGLYISLYVVTYVSLQYKGNTPRMVPMVQGNPPASIPPKITPKTKQQGLRFLDIDPSELARQLTLFESDLLQKIRPMECLQRAREQKTDSMDNITTVIQTSNRVCLLYPSRGRLLSDFPQIADWVAELVLSKEDSRKRASIVKHLISVADVCSPPKRVLASCLMSLGIAMPESEQLLHHGCHNGWP